jgi:hypothetical protein
VDRCGDQRCQKVARNRGMEKIALDWKIWRRKIEVAGV